MRKQELRKLRSLPPTKEMIEKAKDNKIHELIKGNYYKSYYTRRYKFFLRVQNLSCYIKIAIYSAENLAANITTPKFEIFINKAGEECITRIFKDNGEEERWSNAMLYNLPGIYSWYSTEKYKKTFWLNRDASRTLKSLTDDCRNVWRTEDDAIACLRNWQQSLKDKERALREKKETAPWDEDMKLTPELPKDFDKWLKYSVPTEEWGIYKGGEKTTFCTHCEKEVVLTGTRKMGKKMICPSCKKELEIIQGERYKNHIQSGRYQHFIIVFIELGIGEQIRHRRGNTPLLFKPVMCADVTSCRHFDTIKQRGQTDHGAASMTKTDNAYTKLLHTDSPFRFSYSLACLRMLSMLHSF